MKISNGIPAGVLAAATGMLQPFIPDLSPTRLVAALKAHGTETQTAKSPEKPLTRKEAAELLSISYPTLRRYLKAGMLKEIQMGPRLIRIDQTSVKNLLEKGETK